MFSSLDIQKDNNKQIVQMMLFRMISDAIYSVQIETQLLELLR